jgi:uncharacterized coiled-coil protein SlyX
LLEAIKEQNNVITSISAQMQSLAKEFKAFKKDVEQEAVDIMESGE